MIQAIFSFFAAASSSPCPEKSILGFPAWYHYLGSQMDASGKCTPVISGLNDIWLIVAAIIEILLRVAAIAAVIFVIWGGVEYMTSQGSPEGTSHARGTIINALIGLAIAVLSAAIISFIAGSIT